MKVIKSNSMPGRKLRSTRKGSKDKDYAKIHEGSPLPDDDEQMSSLTLATSAKLNKKQKKVANFGTAELAKNF